ncbi:hypothetical protein HYALB_00006951 [Hymenoscyphus albidus]|uniref:Uncharacterized protein n=1 Tax=Hymenoscyphus albidus TaxID=595503 RepID=A0A9N9Q2T7_9HELO|nr:hypothetical protein HYALB_00006951 [Hymenoscyphus albidus]
MVQQAPPSSSSRTWNALPSQKDLAFRRISSVFLMAGLLTVITPFRPVTWFLPISGPDILDQFIAPPLFLGALFAQWRIAGVSGALVIDVMDVGFVYHSSMYWTCAFAELCICLGVGMARNEYLRRGASLGLVGGLWAVGWGCTPVRYKMQAWDILKWVWTMLAIDHARASLGGGRRRY